VVSVIGGESIADQLYDIQQGCDVVVATSGRLIDILDKKQINLSKLEFFVLDEADKMLDLGFAQELEVILKALPQKRQNLLFSATYPPKMMHIASRITQDAVEVSIEEERQTVDNIHQRAICVNRENRGPLLRHLISTNEWELILVFMANKRATDNIAAKFRKRGFKAESFHGDLDQEDRNYTLDAFKSRKIKILFATDIAARGLDIDDVNCVVNFDLPRSPADYIHRIGRTARAGKSGVAISFIGHEDSEHFKLIEKRSDIRLEREQIDGFELTGDAPEKVKGKAPVKGKRKSKKDKAREKEAKDLK
jgi:superfamily II DNA/RNA helicase